MTLADAMTNPRPVKCWAIVHRDGTFFEDANGKPRLYARRDDAKPVAWDTDRVVRVQVSVVVGRN